MQNRIMEIDELKDQIIQQDKHWQAEVAKIKRLSEEETK
jgi:hypothetical protein